MNRRDRANTTSRRASIRLIAARGEKAILPVEGPPDRAFSLEEWRSRHPALLNTEAKNPSTTALISPAASRSASAHSERTT